MAADSYSQYRDAQPSIQFAAVPHAHNLNLVSGCQNRPHQTAPAERLLGILFVNKCRIHQLTVAPFASMSVYNFTVGSRQGSRHDNHSLTHRDVDHRAANVAYDLTASLVRTWLLETRIFLRIGFLGVAGNMACRNAKEDY
uniref:Uncharacterized protein n=1 Tax=Steinernema glaseri TaxID=37863 RepID=A0A1I7ZV02_9BILA